MTKQDKALVVVVVLALVGMGVLLVATRQSIGVLPDSTVYFDAARNLANGRGLYVISGTDTGLQPLNHYPPLYSTLLAFMSSTGTSLEASARWLNVTMLAANIVLVGGSLSFCRPSSFWLPVIGSFLALTAPDLLAMHAVAMTEPLYLSLTFGGLLWLGIYLERQRRFMLVFSAFLIGLSFLTRFVGIAGVVTGLIGLLIIVRDESGRMVCTFPKRRGILYRRVIDVLIFGLLSCGPIALWSIRSRLAAGGASDRQLAFHPVKVQQIVSAFSTAAQWLLLGKVRLDVRFVAFIIEVLVLAALTICLLRKGRQAHNIDAQSRMSLLYLLAIFTIIYLAFLIFTITFFETDNVLDSRSLLPVHFAMLMLVPLLAASLAERVPEARSLRIVMVVLALLVAGSYVFRSARWVETAQGASQGYAGRAWKESAGLAQIRKLPFGTPIYSNGVDAIYYLTGRRAFDIPAKIIHGTGRPNASYEAERQKMSDDLRQHHGVLVYFNTLPERWYLPRESDLQNELPLAEVAAAPDASIYELKPDKNNQPAH